MLWDVWLHLPLFDTPCDMAFVGSRSIPQASVDGKARSGEKKVMGSILLDKAPIRLRQL